MQNPWLEIPYTDYENHMLEAGQSTLLSELISTCLRRYNPETFALLGCASGNGLEHITSSLKKAFAIDINPQYLQIVREKFTHQQNIKTIHADIEKDVLELKNIDLLFAGLVLEYVDLEKALSNIAGALSKLGVLVIVIQKSKKGNFVTSSRYKSLEKLRFISHEVDEESLIDLLVKGGFKKLKRSVHKISAKKSFIALEFQQNTIIT